MDALKVFRPGASPLAQAFRIRQPWQRAHIRPLIAARNPTFTATVVRRANSSFSKQWTSRFNSTSLSRRFNMLRLRNPVIRRMNSSKPHLDPTPHLGSPEPAPSLSQRLKQLSKEYGWCALGVYLALSALDFPFCFLAVRWLGAEAIGQYEHAAVEWFKEMMPWPSSENAPAQTVGVDQAQVQDGQGEALGEEAKKRNGNDADQASIWTQLALAYAIHKSFIFFRVPLTAAVTPKVVKVLRSWGWNVGRKSSKAVKSAK
ncbi:hypothetical protein L228DRAFT_266041 [Xylona heveae TC161]|uniref:DUF1279 domain-containing protein n=1 Tax=Xylona heveae (strain CBS 132557 / TC161) TaxID=1328760 RepID=A0A165IZ86_XYLHT|nr:hypothetical protein L228DRAFT_266041 [Xylona heveae TC161]KZF25578.1 hypothetical protein L228DRAFT_266041 [Xylona heveae TC161]